MRCFSWTCGNSTNGTPATPPTALHVPLATVAERLGEITDAAEGRPVAFICRTGSRSAQASEVAVRGGQASVLNVEGGMTAWTAAGEPVTS